MIAITSPFCGCPAPSPEPRIDEYNTPRAWRDAHRMWVMQWAALVNAHAEGSTWCPSTAKRRAPAKKRAAKKEQPVTQQHDPILPEPTYGPDEPGPSELAMTLVAERKEKQRAQAEAHDRAWYAAQQVIAELLADCIGAFATGYPPPGEEWRVCTTQWESNVTWGDEGWGANEATSDPPVVAAYYCDDRNDLVWKWESNGQVYSVEVEGDGTERVILPRKEFSTTRAAFVTMTERRGDRDEPEPVPDRYDRAEARRMGVMMREYVADRWNDAPPPKSIPSTTVMQGQWSPS